MAKIKKKEVLENIKSSVDEILSTLERLEDFESAKIYICDIETSKKLLELDNDLLPLRSESIRGKAYNISKIVNIINPHAPAYDFSLVKVEKYPYVSNQEKCLKKLPQEIEVSANFHRKRINEQIESSDYSEHFKKKLAVEIELLIEKEREDVEEVLQNPDEYIIRISGYKERLIYGQINYGYYHVDAQTSITTKKRANKHLSITFPNVIVYQPNEDADKHRIDMEVKYLNKIGFSQIARRVFIKRKSGVMKKNG